MVIYDFEVFKYDWMVCALDTQTRKFTSIVNASDKLADFFDKKGNEIWVGYNSRGYDQWVLKCILSGLNPYKITDFIINKKQKGFMFSDLLRKWRVINYDCMVGFKGLKELEAHMGHDIKESSVPFDIQRPLTPTEINEVVQYCKHDVMETLEVFVRTSEVYESHLSLIKTFEMPLPNVSKTKAQLSAMILGASPRKRDDEFGLDLPDTLEMGRYEDIKTHYLCWADDSKRKHERNPHDETLYDGLSLTTTLAGVPHTYGIGGLHGAIPKYKGKGLYILADVASYYPALIIEYDYLSRNVFNKQKYRTIRDMRIELKAIGDPKEGDYKLVLNGTFGASKDPYNALYDPRQANNICVAGQLFLTDLVDKLEDFCDIIQTNTDGVLFKCRKESDKDKLIAICEKWSERTRMDLTYDIYTEIYQKDVNNYIVVTDDGKLKRKGAYVKKLKEIDRDLPIVNKAIVDYFTKGVPVEQTVNSSNELIDFQKITKIGKMYSGVFKEDVRGTNHSFHKFVSKRSVRKGIIVREWKERISDDKCGKFLNTKVNRVFACNSRSVGGLYKLKQGKTSLDKMGGTPERCVVINDNIIGKPVPSYIDRQWYIDLAKERIRDFGG